MPAYDVIVAGLGAMGSATTAELASRGVSVLGIDALRPPHDRGSSHGDTRVIREAYWEHPLYVPLVRRAYDRWHRLEKDSGQRLLVTTGALLMGAEEGPLIQGTLASAHQHQLDWEQLTAADIGRRYPLFRPDADAVGILERRAAVLFPEKCIAAFLTRAEDRGAELRLEEPISEWRIVDGAVEVTTSQGRYSAGRLVMAVGAWAPELISGLPLEIERQVMHWFEPGDRSAFAPDRFPIFLFEEADGGHWYGLPDFGLGLKAAIHHGGATTTADSVDRAVGDADTATIRAVLRRRIPLADAVPSRSKVCIYTNTPDANFLIDTHPEHPECLIVSACSGHGFKFSSVIGEIAADLVTTGSTHFELGPFLWTASRMRASRTLERGAVAH